jgi:hypothetical protein
MNDIKHVFYVGSLCLGLFFGMLLLMEIGRRIGVGRRASDSEASKATFSTIEGGILTLFALLLTFTFSGAGARFDARRQLIVQETNAIGTAYLRLDVLPAAIQPGLRDNFRRYLNARLNVYRKLPDLEAAKQELTIANSLQREIWRQSISAVRADDAPPQAAVVLLPALNAMIDIATTVTMAPQFHPPLIIFGMLFVVALTSSLLACYGMGAGIGRSWLHMLCFGVVIAFTVYVIIDIEYPSAGLIRVNAFDQALVELRDSMK